MSATSYDPYILRDWGGEDDMANRILLWWARISGDDKLLQSRGGHPLPPGVRATLRRARGPDDALLTEGFRRLWFDLPPPRRRPWDMRARGCVAAVLAEVREHDPDNTFAGAMGLESAHGTDTPRVSELRFQQLLRSNDLDELLRRARRTVHLLGRKVHVSSLTDDLLHWHQEQSDRWTSRPDRRLAVRWANDYFTELARYQKNAG